MNWPHMGLRDVLYTETAGEVTLTRFPVPASNKLQPTLMKKGGVLDEAKGGVLDEAKGGDLAGGGLATRNGSDSDCSDVAICIGGPGAFLDNGCKDEDWVTNFVATQGNWGLG